jgi:hypothetical protein
MTPPDARSGPADHEAASQNLNQGQYPTDPDTAATPYARAWRSYVAAGWAGPIPIATSWRGQPSDGKFPPAAGYTGRRNYGTWPTLDQMHEWRPSPTSGATSRSGPRTT